MPPADQWSVIDSILCRAPCIFKSSLLYIYWSQCPQKQLNLAVSQRQQNWFWGTGQAWLRGTGQQQRRGSSKEQQKREPDLRGPGHSRERCFLGGHFVRQRGSPQALCTSSRFYFEQKNHKIKRSHARIALEIQCHGFIVSYLLHRSFLLLILVAMLYKPLLSFQTLFLTCPPVAVFFHP